MENAQSEPVRLKAATEILDRAGVRGGVELDVGVDVNIRSSKDIVLERLERMASAARDTVIELPSSTKIIDAEPILEDSTNSTGENQNGSEDDGK
jgi:hypothetical protein